MSGADERMSMIALPSIGVWRKLSRENLKIDRPMLVGSDLAVNLKEGPDSEQGGDQSPPRK